MKPQQTWMFAMAAAAVLLVSIGVFAIGGGGIVRVRVELKSDADGLVVLAADGGWQWVQFRGKFVPQSAGDLILRLSTDARVGTFLVQSEY